MSVAIGVGLALLWGLAVAAEQRHRARHGGATVRFAVTFWVGTFLVGAPFTLVALLSLEADIPLAAAIAVWGIGLASVGLSLAMSSYSVDLSRSDVLSVRRLLRRDSAMLWADISHVEWNASWRFLSIRSSSAQCTVYAGMIGLDELARRALQRPVAIADDATREELTRWSQGNFPSYL